MPEVDQVLGNEEKLGRDRSAPRRAAISAARASVADIMTVRETAGDLIEGLDGRTRAFLQVQQGCDHRCTFCVIPFGRGNTRSLPMGDSDRQARRLVEAGFKEIVLTGVDLGAMAATCRAADARPAGAQPAAPVPELERLRLSSSIRWRSTTISGA